MSSRELTVEEPSALDVEGPVRAEAVQAIAATSSVGFESFGATLRPAGSVVAGRHGGRRSDDPFVHLGHLPMSRMSGRRGAALVAACLGILAMLILVVQASNRAGPTVSIATVDRAYVSRANQACTAQLHHGIAGPATVASLVVRLDKIPVAASAAPEVDEWLVDLKSYVADERAANSPGSSKLTREDGTAALTGADEFALHNGLLACSINIGTSNVYESIP